MTDFSESVQHRMRAIQLEGQTLWAEAAAAWHRAIDALPMGSPGSSIDTHAQEMRARAASAERMAPGVDAAPVPDEQQVVDAREKPEAERVSPVERQDPGKTEGDSGAR